MKAVPLVIILLQASLVCSTFAWGPCPSIPLKSEEYISSKTETFYFAVGNFQALDFLGVWYDVLRNADFPFSKGNCTQANYFLDNSNIKVINSEIIHGKNVSATADIYLGEASDGQLYARFYKFAPLGNLKVLRTDYSQTALVFSCKSIYIAHWKWAWVLVRNTNIQWPQEYERIIEELGIPLDGMINVDHSPCFERN